MRILFWSVDHYGWLWAGKKPTAKALVEFWAQGKATEVGIYVPGKRDLKI